MAEKWLAWSGPFTAGLRQALNGREMAGLKWAIYGWLTASLSGSEMARLKGAIYGWLMAGLKWQTNGYTETGHLQ